jgi:hypothetical protein
VARVSLGGDRPIIPAHPPLGGLDVVFAGVEVVEVRPGSVLGWRKALAATGLAALALACVGAWTRVDRTGMTADHFREGAVLTALLGIYGLLAARHVGVVWRFDHRRRTITRRHWLGGLARRWNAAQVCGATLRRERNRTGRDEYELCLLGPGGSRIARVGRWEAARVDARQVEAVLGEIKKVMWWH